MTRTPPLSASSKSSSRISIEVLWEDYFRSRSTAAEQQLILHYMPIVQFTAGRLYFKRNAQIDREDLIQYGVLGLRNALSHFDPSRGVKFETYCVQRIRGSMLDGLKAQQWIPRDIKRRIASFLAASQQLQHEAGHNMDRESLAQNLGLDETELHQVERYAYSANPMSLNSPCFTSSADQSTSHADSLPDPREESPEDHAHRRDIRRLLLQELTEIQRRIMMLYYYEQLSMREIGHVLNISATRVSQIHAGVLEDLKRRLNRHTTDSAFWNL